jgi:hypothetical protein
LPTVGALGQLLTLTPAPFAALSAAARRGAYEEALQHQIAEGGAYEETITWSKARAALRAPSNLVLILQAVPGCLPWGVIGAYLNDYFSQVGTAVCGLILGLQTGRRRDLCFALELGWRQEEAAGESGLRVAEESKAERWPRG